LLSNFLRAQEVEPEISCILSIPKAEIETFEPLTLKFKFVLRENLDFKPSELKLILEFKKVEEEEPLIVEEVTINPQWKGKKFKGSINFIYDFQRNKYYFEEAGLYFVKAIVKGSVSCESQELSLQIINGSLSNLQSMNSNLYDQIHQQSFALFLYTREMQESSISSTGNALIEAFPNAFLSLYTKLVLALENFERIVKEQGSVAPPSEYLQQAQNSELLLPEGKSSSPRYGSRKK
jgi:hypothetical protein